MHQGKHHVPQECKDTKSESNKKTSTTPKQLIKDKIYKINVIKRLEKEQKSGTLYMFFLT